MESFYWKNLGKSLNESAAIAGVICQIYHEKWEQNQHRPSAFFTFHAKKVKEVLRTSLSGNKITWTETFVRSKKFAKSKATLNWGTLACYEDLPIKPTLKNVQSFLCVTVISRFSSLHCLSSITHKILITDIWTRTDHCNSRLFWKYSLLEKQSLISEL